MSAEHTAHSRKPSNIIVEFDIGTSFENLAQAGLLSNDPLATFASISALCALVSRRTQIELDPETGFVYWVAYDNRHDGWEIHKRELTGLASKESKSGDVPFELTEDDVEGHIRQLYRYNSIDIEYTDGAECVILRELCSADWLN